MEKAIVEAAETHCSKTKSLAFTSNQLKMIAVVAMLFDHCVIVFIPHSLEIYHLLRMPGKLTAPIMCFLIAQGYYHTSNLKRYIGRLFGMAVISHIPFTLFFGYNPWEIWRATDVLWTLLLGLLALTVYHRKGWSIWKRIFFIGICCLLAYSADWNYVGVLLVLFFGIFHEDRNLQTMSHIAVSCLYGVQAVFYGASFVARIGVFFSIPFLRRYNGQRGKKSKLIQWGFYWFYPLHLLALYLIKQLL